jgi:ABC-type glycerol-3-phosphate transport system permease component
VHAILLLGAALVAFPFLWMLLTSLKTPREAAGFPPTFLPSVPQWHNYADAWSAADFPLAFRNTLGMAVAQAVGNLVISSLAAYAFARIRFKGRDLLFVLFLSSLMVPDEVRLVPTFVILRNLPCPIPVDTLCNPQGGWLDTYTAMTVPFMGTAFSIFLLRQAFLTIPADLWEASRLDGAGHLTYLVRVVLPLSAPALLTVALFSFIGSWNAFLWPLIVTSRPEIRPLQIALATFLQQHGADYQLLMAASAFTVAPVVVIFFFVQRHFIEGIARSGLRG